MGPGCINMEALAVVQAQKQTIAIAAFNAAAAASVSTPAADSTTPADSATNSKKTASKSKRDSAIVKEVEDPNFPIEYIAISHLQFPLLFLEEDEDKLKENKDS